MYIVLKDMHSTPVSFSLPLTPSPQKRKKKSPAKKKKKKRGGGSPWMRAKGHSGPGYHVSGDVAFKTKVNLPCCSAVPCMHVPLVRGSPILISPGHPVPEQPH